MVYTIRRYFFIDPSFFSFQQSLNDTINKTFTEFNSQEIFQKLSDDKKAKYSNTVVDFNEDDFIELRNTNDTFNSIIYLVIHIKSFHIFAMKKIINGQYSKSYSHEVNFDKEYSNCRMTPFYGFVKKRN